MMISMGQCKSTDTGGIPTADDENSPSDEKQTQKRSTLTKGMAMSFGFKKKPQPAPTYTVGNPAAARRLAANDSTDKNGNEVAGGNVPLPSGRSTPKLVPPRKEPHSARVSRFGFRQPNNNRLNKIADVKSIQPSHVYSKDDNNFEATSAKAKVTFADNNNHQSNQKPQQKVSVKHPLKYTLQSSNLPRPQMPVKVESKIVKTAMNNNKRIQSKDEKERDGSTTDDSGVCSNHDNDTRENPIPKPKRNLSVVVTGVNTFDVRDVDNAPDSADIDVPKTPSGFNCNTGIVRERVNNYERNLERKHSRTELESVTSGDIKNFLKSSNNTDPNPELLISNFLSYSMGLPQANDAKARPTSSDHTDSSDDQLWGTTAGEAMAEDIAYSFSSSDESRDFKRKPCLSSTFRKDDNATFESDDNLMDKLARIAGNSTKLLDETSPTESILRTISDELHVAGKEEKAPSSPDTPTNISLSLSDGKDFLIDDEIADQPALVFDDKEKNSENTTLVDSSTPKPRRRSQNNEASPLFVRTKKRFLNRSDSVGTLSTCESIASDDLMMDYDVSEVALEERYDMRSCEASIIIPTTIEKYDLRDWTVLMQLDKKNTVRPSRILKSRGGTPDSPRSLEGRCSGVRSRSSVTGSPMRLQSPRIVTIGSPAGYESDDSVKLERSCHTAMVQEVMGMKTMLLKLKRVLQESETHNLFDAQRNGLFNGLCSETYLDDPHDYRMELEDLRRQVVFLQGQVEDRDRSVQELKEELRQVRKLVAKGCASEPVQITSVDAKSTSNATTQTERIRPLSGSSFTAADNLNSAASASELPNITTPNTQSKESAASASSSSTTTTTSGSSTSLSLPKSPGKLWRKPGDAASPQRYSSFIPRRSASKNRAQSSS